MGNGSLTKQLTRWAWVAPTAGKVSISHPMEVEPAARHLLRMTMEIVQQIRYFSSSLRNMIEDSIVSRILPMQWDDLESFDPSDGNELEGIEELLQHLESVTDVQYDELAMRLSRLDPIFTAARLSHTSARYTPPIINLHAIDSAFNYLSPDRSEIYYRCLTNIHFPNFHSAMLQMAWHFLSSCFREGGLLAEAKERATFMPAGPVVFNNAHGNEVKVELDARCHVIGEFRLGFIPHTCLDDAALRSRLFAELEIECEEAVLFAMREPDVAECMLGEIVKPEAKVTVIPKEHCDLIRLLLKQGPVGKTDALEKHGYHAVSWQAARVRANKAGFITRTDDGEWELKSHIKDGLASGEIRFEDDANETE